MEKDLIKNLNDKFQNTSNIRSLTISYSDELFEFLLENSEFADEFKSRFFKKIGKNLIFKQDDFLQFLDFQTISGSFTAYLNKIGLGNKAKKFLKTREEVVLNFPYKDCLLKGGQSKDDDKNSEILFNEILAKSEIDMLFAPKVLINAVRFSGESKREPTLFDAAENQSINQ
ncbi:hypothetical protein LMG7974_01727 [Campylobacter majalis]|uniref:Type III restriction/modification enzyme methylation subunit domain-containing protein n=2 Tax=Campylobacter majalis TaxID=2790656 RepID=A0ABN7KBN1_9BACT|nr:hypothetical protein LMG7974_01727 [Campylobacter majalis]